MVSEQLSTTTAQEAGKSPELSQEKHGEITSLADVLILGAESRLDRGEQAKYNKLSGYVDIKNHIRSMEGGKTLPKEDSFPIMHPESQIPIHVTLDGKPIDGRVTALGQYDPKDKYMTVQITDGGGTKIVARVDAALVLHGQMECILSDKSQTFTPEEQKLMRASIALANGDEVKPDGMPNADELKKLYEKSPLLTKDKALRKARQLVEGLPEHPGAKPEPEDANNITDDERRKIADWTGKTQKWEDLGKAEQDRITELNTLLNELEDSSETLANPAKVGRLLALGHEPTVRKDMARLKEQIHEMEQSMQESVSVGDPATAKKIKEKLDGLRDELKLKDEALQNFELNVVDLIKKVNAGEITHAINNEDGSINLDPSELMNKFINGESADVAKDLQQIDGAIMLKKTMALLKDNKSEAIKTFFEKYRGAIMVGGAFALIAFRIIEYALQKSEKA